MVENAKIKETIANIVEKIRDNYKPEKIILFGSYAYGRPNAESDIDLFIIKKTQKRRIDRFCEVSRLLRNIKGISIQPVVFTRQEVARRLELEDDFIKEILHKGEILYEKEN